MVALSKKDMVFEIDAIILHNIVNFRATLTMHKFWYNRLIVLSLLKPLKTKFSTDPH